MPTEIRTCKKCGKLFKGYFSPFNDAKGWGTYCSKACSVSVRSTAHGNYANDKPSKTYITWQSMRQRCHDPNSDRFLAYGGAGIVVCDEWRHDFNKFLQDMGERPAGHTLDRIDPSGPYSKANCRWATAKEQASNRRNNKLIDFNGSKITITEAARLSGLNKQTVFNRVKNGWPESLWFIKNDSRKAPSQISSF